MKSLPPLKIDRLAQAEGSRPEPAPGQFSFDVSRFVATLLAECLAKGPCEVSADLPPEGESVRVDLRCVGQAVSTLAECPRRAFIPVLGFMEGVILEEVYGGAVQRRLEAGGRGARALFFLSNDQLSGHWFRIYCSAAK